MSKEMNKRDAALKSLRKSERERESFTDARSRYRYSHREWPMIAVLALIADASQLTGKTPVSVRMAEQARELLAARPRAIDHVRQLDRLWNELRAKNKGKPPEREVWLPARDRLLELLGTAQQESLWQRLLADFERAVLDRDAGWFKRQAKAIRRIGFHQTHGANKARFEVAVLCELQYAGPGMTAQDILDRLEHRKEGQRLFVEGCLFSRASRCREEIKRLSGRKGVTLAG
jgi:hypothetical protein